MPTSLSFPLSHSCLYTILVVPNILAYPQFMSFSKKISRCAAGRRLSLRLPARSEKTTRSLRSQSIKAKRRARFVLAAARRARAAVYSGKRARSYLASLLQNWRVLQAGGQDQARGRQAVKIVLASLAQEQGEKKVDIGSLCSQSERLKDVQDLARKLAEQGIHAFKHRLAQAQARYNGPAA